MSILIGGCCCGPEPGDDCAYCEFTPKYWTVTLSGVEPGCSECFESITSPGVWGKVLEMTGLDGVHLLTQKFGDPCVWEKLIFGTWEVGIYNSEANCDADNPSITRGHEFSIRLTRTEAGWTLVVGIPDVESADRGAFEDFVAEDADDNCTTIATMTNEVVCDVGVTFITFISDSGNATFEVGDQT